MAIDCLNLVITKRNVYLDYLLVLFVVVQEIKALTVVEENFLRVSKVLSLA